MTDTFLERRAIEAGYGASQLLFGIALRIRSGQVVLILGRNGMSKSMTLKTLVGSLVLLAGFKPDAIAHPDMALAPEILVCFADNSNQPGNSWTMDRIYTVFPKLKERVNNLGNQLAGGEQQMLAIGRALSANPRLLILDEATEGLASVIRE